MSRRRSPSPADIAPDGFLDRFPDADDYSDALAKAEQMASTTPIERRKRCPAPDCETVRIIPKYGGDQPHKVDSNYVCSRCREHFDTARPPDAVVETELTVALRLGSDTELCCACGGDARVYLYDPDVGVDGAVCFDHIGDLLAKELGADEDD